MSEGGQDGRDGDDLRPGRSESASNGRQQPPPDLDVVASVATSPSTSATTEPAPSGDVSVPTTAAQEKEDQEGLVAIKRADMPPTVSEAGVKELLVAALKPIVRQVKALTEEMMVLQSEIASLKNLGLRTERALGKKDKEINLLKRTLFQLTDKQHKPVHEAPKAAAPAAPDTTVPPAVKVQQQQQQVVTDPPPSLPVTTSIFPQASIGTAPSAPPSSSLLPSTDEPALLLFQLPQRVGAPAPAPAPAKASRTTASPDSSSSSRQVPTVAVPSVGGDLPATTTTILTRSSSSTAITVRAPSSRKASHTAATSSSFFGPDGCHPNGSSSSSYFTVISPPALCHAMLGGGQPDSTKTLIHSMRVRLTEDHDDARSLLKFVQAMPGLVRVGMLPTWSARHRLVQDPTDGRLYVVELTLLGGHRGDGGDERAIIAQDIALRSLGSVASVIVTRVIYHHVMPNVAVTVTGFVDGTLTLWDAIRAGYFHHRVHGETRRCLLHKRLFRLGLRLATARLALCRAPLNKILLVGSRSDLHAKNAFEVMLLDMRCVAKSATNQTGKYPPLKYEVAAFMKQLEQLMDNSSTATVRCRPPSPHDDDDEDAVALRRRRACGGLTLSLDTPVSATKAEEDEEKNRVMVVRWGYKAASGPKVAVPVKKDGDSASPPSPPLNMAVQLLARRERPATTTRTSSGGSLLARSSTTAARVVAAPTTSTPVAAVTGAGELAVVLEQWEEEEGVAPTTPFGPLTAAADQTTTTPSDDGVSAATTTTTTAVAAQQQEDQAAPSLEVEDDDSNKTVVVVPALHPPTAPAIPAMTDKEMDVLDRQLELADNQGAMNHLMGHLQDPAIMYTKNFPEYMAQYELVDRCVRKDTHGTVACFRRRKPFFRSNVANDTTTPPEVAVRTMFFYDEEGNRRPGTGPAEAKKEIELMFAIAHLPCGVTPLHYRITADFAEVVTRFYPTRLVDLMNNGFFDRDCHAVRVRRWYRLLHLLLDAYSSFRALGIAHKNLKPTNILVVPAEDRSDDFTIKVVNMGSGCFDADTTSAYLAGTPLYMPPEVALCDPSKPEGTGHDAFSVGVIMVQVAKTMRLTRAGHPARTASSGTTTELPEEAGERERAAEEGSRLLGPRGDHLSDRVMRNINSIMSNMPPPSQPVVAAPHEELVQEALKVTWAAHRARQQRHEGPGVVAGGGHGDGEEEGPAVLLSMNPAVLICSYEREARAGMEAIRSRGLLLQEDDAATGGEVEELLRRLLCYNAYERASVVENYDTVLGAVADKQAAAATGAGRGPSSSPAVFSGAWWSKLWGGRKGNKAGAGPRA